MPATSRKPIIDIVLLVAACVSLPAFAAAYIDPGSGSILLQAILAAIFGSILFFKVLWQRIRTAVARIFSPSSSASSEHDEK